MKPLFAFAILFLSACAALPGSQALPTPIRVLGHSNNRGVVDVYLLCGSQNARWLGVLSEKEVAAFEIPAAEARCVSGLNFFLVSQRSGRGYWVGPLRPQAGAHIDLTIEKYAGLSTARLR